MFRHILLLLVTTVLASLALDSGFFKGRRQNYNSNANYNELYGGYGGGRLGSDGGSRLGYDGVSGRDRGGLYAGSLKNGIDRSDEIGRGKDRGRLGFGSPKYAASGSGSGDLDNEYLAREDMDWDNRDNGLGSCSGLLDSLFPDDDDEEAVSEEPTNDDGSPQRLINYNSNYNVVFKGSNRRQLGYRPYRGSAGPRGNNDANSNANSNTIGSRYRRTYNWGTLRPPYESVGDSDRNPYNKIGKLYDRNDEDLDRNLYKKIGNFYDRNEQDYERTGRDYEQAYRGTNVNSNVNNNILSGRRGNVNSNANNNDIRYGGYGQGRGNDRLLKSPPYSVKPGSGYSSYGAQQGSYGGYTTSRYPMLGYTPRPAYAAYRDSDDGEDEDKDYNQLQNGNINSNSNVNVNSNANSNLYSRNKRSVKKLENLSENVDREENRGTSTLSNEGTNTAPKPVAEKLENSRSSIYHDLM